MSVIVKRKPVPPLKIVLADCVGGTLTLEVSPSGLCLKARVKIKDDHVEVSPSDARALARVLVEWADGNNQD